MKQRVYFNVTCSKRISHCPKGQRGRVGVSIRDQLAGLYIPPGIEVLIYNDKGELVCFAANCGTQEGMSKEAESSTDVVEAMWKTIAAYKERKG